jgi:hypothetical protein
MDPLTNSITDIARLAGSYKWCELQIAAALGTWSDVIPESSASALCGSHAHVHAWHAELWNDRIPTLWDADNTQLMQPPRTDAETAIQRLGNQEMLATTAQKLDAMYCDVLPILRDMYTTHVKSIESRVDPPTARILELCITDTDKHIAHGKSVLDAVLKSAT